MRLKVFFMINLEMPMKNKFGHILEQVSALSIHILRSTIFANECFYMCW